MAANPEHCSKRSRIGALHTVLYGTRTGAGGCQYSCVWYDVLAKENDRSTFRQGLARSGPQDAGRARFHGAESRAAGESIGGIARQLLLAFRRHRRLPRGDPQALARGGRRADHRQSRGRLRQPRPAAAPAAPGVRRQAGAGERGSHLGNGRPAGAKRRAGHRPASPRLRRKHAQGIRAFARRGPCARANFLLGICRLCAVGQTVAAGKTAGGARRTAADGLAIRAARIHVTIGYATASNEKPETRMMTSPPERLEGTVDPKLLEILVCPLTKGPLEFDAARQELISRSAKLAYPIRDGIPIMLPEEARKIE